VWPPCPEGCFPTFRFGVERAGLEEGIDVLFEILPVQTPLVHNATVLDSAGAPTSLDNLERLDDPAFGIPVGPWPTLVVELSDPHLPAGLGGTVEVWACPQQLAPPDASCVVQPTTASLEGVVTGDMTFRTDTRPLGEATCAAVADGTWPEDLGGELYAVVTGHVCGIVPPMPLSANPLRFVVEDCGASR
jgi:hypothetical protein